MGKKDKVKFRPLREDDVSKGLPTNQPDEAGPSTSAKPKPTQIGKENERKFGKDFPSSTISQKMQKPGESSAIKPHGSEPSSYEVSKSQGAKKKAFSKKNLQHPSSTIAQKNEERQETLFYEEPVSESSPREISSSQGTKKKTLPKKEVSQTKQLAEKSNKQCIPLTERSEPKYVLCNPTPGTEGRLIKVETNYFKLDLGDLEMAYHYDVKIDPTDKRKYRNIMEIFGMRHFRSIPYVYDNNANLYTVREINDISYLSGETQFEETTYKIDIKLVGVVDLKSLRNLSKSAVTPKEALQVVDIVLRNGLSKSLLMAGRSFFFRPDGKPAPNLGDGMEMLNGFYLSAVRGQNIYVNVDVAHKAVPKNIGLIEALKDMFHKINLSNKLIPDQYNQFGNFVKNLKISYELPMKPSSRRVYTINELNQDPASKQTFNLKEGQKITIKDYFLKEKNITLKYPNLPTVWVGNRKKSIYLPLELCVIEKEQMIQKSLTPSNKRAMIEYTALNTKDRKLKIMESINNHDFNNDPSVKDFGFSVDNTFLQLDARILKPPVLLYQNNKLVIPKNGQWFKDRNSKFQNSVSINKWKVVSCVNQRYELGPMKLKELGTRIRTFSDLNIADQGYPELVGDIENDIKNFFEKTDKESWDIVFVVISDKGSEYASVKKFELYTNCLTQCIKQRTVNMILSDERKAAQTISNIILKVNAKLNGKSHILQDPPPSLKSCMIMGADVTHPGLCPNKPSVAAVTASHDSNACNYSYCWRLQDPNVEIIKDMEAVLQELLQVYKDKNGTLPKNIIYFRDGVSEGQFNQIIENEIKDIKSACFHLKSDYKPLITCVVVQKRHHTRLFPVNKEDSRDKNFNVPPGTYVDTEITHPYMQEFYLVSHASIRGVARPTKYTTIFDDNKLSNDEIEKLTYYLCHLYSRCNRSVSYPAPTYYAHLGAARAKVYIHNEKLDLDNLKEKNESLVCRNTIRKSNPLYFI